MYLFITILIIIVCILLGAVVLIQNPKGGGLSASMGGVGQQLLGARRSTDIVEKLTWGFAIAFIVLTLSTSMLVNKNAGKADALPTPDIQQTVGTGTNAFTTPQGTSPQQQPAPTGTPAQ